MTIRQKLFLILGISQIVLIFALVTSFGILIQSIKNEPQNKRAAELTGTFEQELSDREDFLRSVLKEFLSNKDFIQFIQNNNWNREILTNKKIEIFDRFKRE